MSRRLEEQIRRYTEHMDAVAPPVEALLPPDLRDDTGRTHIGTVTVTVPARPRGTRGVPGWVFALGGAAAVLVLAIPLLLWIGAGSPEIGDTTATTVVTPTTVATPTTAPAPSSTGIGSYPVVFNGVDQRVSGTGWEPGVEIVAALEVDTGVETRTAIPDSDGRFVTSPFDRCCSDRTVLTVTQGDRSLAARIDRGIVIDLIDVERDLITVVYGGGLDVTLTVEGGGDPFTTTVTPDSDWWSVDLSESIDLVPGMIVTAIIERNGVAFTNATATGSRDPETGIDLTAQWIEGRGFLPRAPLDLRINGIGLPGGLVTDDGGHFVVALPSLGVSLEPGDTIRLEYADDIIETTIPDLSFDAFDPSSGVARGTVTGADVLGEAGIQVLRADGSGTRIDIVSDVTVESGSWKAQFPALAGGEAITDAWIATNDSDWMVTRHLDISAGRPARPLVALDLPAGSLHGSGFPTSSPVSVSVDGGSTWDVAGRTNSDGMFELTNLLTAPPGTELIVEIEGITASTVIPDVSVTDIDIVQDTVIGMIDLTSAANCCINLYVFTDQGDTEAEQFPLTIRDDGTWFADLRGRFDLTRTSRLGVDYQDPGGISIQWEHDAITSG